LLPKQKIFYSFGSGTPKNGCSILASGGDYWRLLTPGEYEVPVVILFKCKSRKEAVFSALDS
jgi:hypothetical protein